MQHLLKLRQGSDNVSNESIEQFDLLLNDLEVTSFEYKFYNIAYLLEHVTIYFYIVLQNNLEI